MYSRVSSDDRRHRFDAFEVDTRSRELTRDGARIPLQDVPFRFLAALLEHPGEVCSRDQLRSEIWPPEVHLDFDGALATAARKVRQALGDASQSPRYIETLPGRGFRFIGEVASAPQSTRIDPRPEPSKDPAEKARAAPPVLDRRHPPLASRRIRRTLATSLLGASTLVTLTVLAYARHWPPFPAPVQPTIRRLTTGDAEIYAARLMPQGHEVAVGGSWNGGPCELVRIALGSTEKLPTGLEGHPLAVGAAGEWAVALRPSRSKGSYGTFLGTLARGLHGDSAPKEILENVFFADFSPSGELAVVRLQGGLFRLEYPQGTVRLEGPGFPGSPRFSADGRHLAFHLDEIGGRVMVLDLLNGSIRPLTEAYRFIRGLAWRGNEIWFTAGVTTQTDLLAVDLSGRVRIVHKGTSRFQLQDIGPDGKVLLVQSEVRPEGLVWSGNGEQPKVFDRQGHFWLRGLSDDGRQLLGWHMDAQGKHHMVLFRTEGGPPLDLAGGSSNLALSWDGRWVAALLQEPAPHLEVFPTGIGRSLRIPLPGIQSASDVRWMPDGRRLLFTGNEPGRPFRIYLRDPEEEQPRAVTPEGPILGALVSPDGRRLAVERDDGCFLADMGEAPPAMVPIPALEANERVAGWSRDARSLFVYRPGHPPLRVWKVDPTRGRRSFWKAFPFGAHPGAYLNSALVTTDGRAVCAQSYRNPGTLYLLEGLR